MTRLSKPSCTVMNYKLHISSHSGIIFGNGDAYGMLFCYLDLYHLNEDFKTANTVNTKNRQGTAGAHVSLFCQTSAGFLTGQPECLCVAIL